MNENIGIGYVRLSEKDRDIKSDIALIQEYFSELTEQKVDSYKEFLSGLSVETSISNQINEIVSYAKNNKVSLSCILIEKYVSGDNPNRPEFKKIFALAESKKYNMLILRALDRLTRGGSETQEDNLFLLVHYGVQVVSLTEDISNEFNRYLYGFINKIPIILGRMKTKNMMNKKKDSGVAYIRAPFGYKNVKKKDVYWQPTSKSKIVSSVYELLLSGVSKKNIMARYNINRHLFARIYQNKNYVGVSSADVHKSIISHNSHVRGSNKKIIETKKVEYFGNHQPLISPQTWKTMFPDDMGLVEELL